MDKFHFEVKSADETRFTINLNSALRKPILSCKYSKKRAQNYAPFSTIYHSSQTRPVVILSTWTPSFDPISPTRASPETTRPSAIDHSATISTSGSIFGLWSLIFVRINFARDKES